MKTILLFILLATLVGIVCVFLVAFKKSSTVSIIPIKGFMLGGYVVDSYDDENDQIIYTLDFILGFIAVSTTWVTQIEYDNKE